MKLILIFEFNITSKFAGDYGGDLINYPQIILRIKSIGQ